MLEKKGRGEKGTGFFLIPLESGSWLNGITERPSCPPHPLPVSTEGISTAQGSFLKLLHKYLSWLEANATLSLPTHTRAIPYTPRYLH